MKAIEYDKDEFFQMYRDGIQQGKIAAHFGVARTTVQRWAKKFCLGKRTTGPKRGHRHPRWNGGRRIIGGYLYVYSPAHPNRTKQRMVAEHRLEAENFLGRLLLRHEVVHHKDGDKLNNHPDNLEVFESNSEHLKAELKGKIPKWAKKGKENIARGQKQRRIREKMLKRGDYLHTRNSSR